MTIKCCAMLPGERLEQFARGAVQPYAVISYEEGMTEARRSHAHLDSGGCRPGGEFDCVANQVDEHLLYKAFVDFEPRQWSQKPLHALAFWTRHPDLLDGVQQSGIQVDCGLGELFVTGTSQLQQARHQVCRGATLTAYQTE
jgi:hypothetical protein